MRTIIAAALFCIIVVLIALTIIGVSDYYAAPHFYLSESTVRGWQQSFKEVLTVDEQNYILEHPIVSFAGEHYNYPVSFYNKHAKEWQGIAHDVLDHIAIATGLVFHKVGTLQDDWSELLNMTEEGEAYLITEVLRAKEREEHFLLSDTYVYDYFALLSKTSFKNLSFEDVWKVKVGVVKDTIYAALFDELYPNHPNVTAYVSTDDAYKSLESGKIDVFMGRHQRLLSMINLYEKTGYKANLTFDIRAETTFGINVNHPELQSIINKALAIIDTEIIVSGWMHTYYDYSGRTMIAQRPLLVIVAILIFVMWRWSRLDNIKLKQMINACGIEVELHTEPKFITRTKNFVSKVYHKIQI